MNEPKSEYELYKAQHEAMKQKEQNEDAVSLIKWLNKKGWQPNIDGTWNNYISGECNYTPENIANLFKQQKEK